MGNVKISGYGIDELIKKLDQIGGIDKYAPEMLAAAAPVLENALKEEVQKAADRGYAEGSLKKSIRANKPKVNEYGHYVSVTAKGKDKKGVRNNEKLAYLHYGTSKQVARPVLSKAVEKAEREAIQKMQKKFDEVVKE